MEQLKPCPLEFPTKYVSLPKAIAIVRDGLNDENTPIQTRLFAIQRVAEMETHNSIPKDCLVGALRWMLEHYDFEV